MDDQPPYQSHPSGEPEFEKLDRPHSYIRAGKQAAARAYAEMKEGIKFARDEPERLRLEQLYRKAKELDELFAREELIIRGPVTDPDQNVEGNPATATSERGG